MRKDSLTAFLRLFHGLKQARSRINHLLKHFDDDPREAVASSVTDLRAHGVDGESIRRIRARRQPGVDADLAWADRPGNHLICSRDAAYPELLRHIPDPPLLLYASGNPDCMQAPQIAIVGSRNCTPGGEQNAYDFALQCAGSGLAVTSGLALGIDAAAHRGALAADGATIAVTGTGLDRVYPRANRRLAEEIAEHGLLLSEFPPGTPPKPAHFPQRNRIISGLAVATLVVEAATRSGSLITARLAAEQGREVFALPGSIHNPLTRGCHRLIRDGATLVESADDIAGELASLLGFMLQPSPRRVETPGPAVDAEHRALLQHIGYDPVDCDLLVQRSGLTMDKLSSMLVTLELNDLIQSAPGGCYVRI